MIKRGTTRIVFVFDKFVVKIPNFLVEHRHFVYGCYCNLSERSISKTTMDITKIAYSYFCSWFGLFQIQAKCKPKLEDLTQKEIDDYEHLHTGDYKKQNFGYYNGTLVCLDYA